MKRLLACFAVLVTASLAAPAFAACTTATSPDTPGTTANAQYEAMLAVCNLVGGANTPLGYQQITALSTAAALTVPSGATAAVVIPESQDVRWRDDGTTPTASVGMPLAAGQTMVYRGDLSLLRFIEQSASAKLNVSYYQ